MASSDIPNVARSLAAWSSLLGADNVHVEGDQTRMAATATYPTEASIVALLRPTTRDQVRGVVDIANANRVPLYPVSRGKNWGLGSRVPATSGCAVVDLRRMNRIVEINEQLAYLTVEPGVTFRQAAEIVGQRCPSHAVNVTLGPPDGSLIGNALERGHGHGLYLDRFRHTCAMEVVLGSGDVLKLGLARDDRAHAAKLHRYGSGPQLDGLFSQSSFGIVTEMTFWLEPRPKDLTLLQFQLSDAKSLESLLSTMRELSYLSGCVLVLHNKHRITFDRNAFLKKGQPRIEAPAGFRLFGVGQILAASAVHGWGLRRHVIGELKTVADGVRYLSPLMRRMARPLKGPIEWYLGHPIDLALDPPIGMPLTLRILAMYSAKADDEEGAHRDDSDLDLDRDRVGVMWCCPTLPMTAEHVTRVLAIAEACCLKRGFPPQLSFLPHNSRSFDSFCAIAYDRDVPGQDERAAECFTELQETLESEGYAPYRVPIGFNPREDATYAEFMRRLKRTLDPNDIIAPGRYDARQHWPSGA